MSVCKVEPEKCLCMRPLVAEKQLCQKLVNNNVGEATPTIKEPTNCRSLNCERQPTMALFRSFVVWLSILPCTTQSFDAIRLKRGSKGIDGTDPNGNAWLYDGSFVQSGTDHNKCGKKEDIAGTNLDDVLCTHRQFRQTDPTPFLYYIPVPNGEYTLNLYFSENQKNDTSRFFSVQVEDVEVAQTYNPWVQGGSSQFAASLLSVHVQVADESLNIELGRTKKMPIINAIEILTASPSSPTAAPFIVSPTSSPLTVSPTSSPLTSSPTSSPPTMPPTSSPSSASPHIYINCGSEESYTDQQGRKWTADAHVTGGTSREDNQLIVQNKDEDGLYQSRRKGESFCEIPIEPGYYKITLHFTETLTSEHGQSSVSDIRIEGVVTFPNVQLVQTSEQGTTYRAHTQVTSRVVSDGVLSIELLQEVGTPAISAIQVEDALLTDALQPVVTMIEANKKAMGYMIHPEGTVWCGGLPTIWLTGHDKPLDPGFCYNGTVREWQPGPALGSSQDRHDCVALDANFDDVDDVICVRGAMRGIGFGYTELHLTQPDGSLQFDSQQMNVHGLQKYPTMRSRLARKLTAADDAPLFLNTVGGGPREDGRENHNRMFKRVPQDVGEFYFEEVDGPWITYTSPACAEVVDLNQDGIDDLILCHRGTTPSQGMLQDSNGNWTDIGWDGSLFKGWNRAKLADINNDGIPDLVTTSTAHGVRILKGLSSAPFVDLETALIELPMPSQSLGVEILDVNNDGLLDIYVVQKGENESGSCFDENGVDVAPDILLLANGDDEHVSFTPIEMEQQIAGCGSDVEKYSDGQLLVVNQNDGSPGDAVLLEWFA